MMTKSKKFLMLILTLMVSVVVNAKVEISGLFYNLNEETKEAEVTSGNKLYSGDVVIPSTVTYEGTEYKVTGIGEKAFENGRITSITIPNSVKNIEKYAFQFCERLESVTELGIIAEVRLVHSEKIYPSILAFSG